MPVVPGRSLKECVNRDDVCPFSLEPLSELNCVLVFEFNGKHYGCCAWLWLEMLCRQGDGRYQHPVFRCELNEDDNFCAFEVCRAHFETDSETRETDPAEHVRRQQLLRQCMSNKLQSTVIRNVEGVIKKIDLRAESPYKWVEIVEVQHKQRTGLRTNVRCGATVEYILFSRNPKDDPKQMKLFV